MNRKIGWILATLRGAKLFATITGGLRGTSTSGYFLASLQLACGNRSATPLPLRRAAAAGNAPALSVSETAMQLSYSTANW